MELEHRLKTKDYFDDLNLMYSFRLNCEAWDRDDNFIYIWWFLHVNTVYIRSVVFNFFRGSITLLLVSLSLPYIRPH